MNETNGQEFDESAPAIKDAIIDLSKDVPEAAFVNVVADPEQERRDLIAVRDAAIVLVDRLDERERDIRKSAYGFDPAIDYEVELDKLKAKINAQHYPKAR